MKKVVRFERKTLPNNESGCWVGKEFIPFLFTYYMPIVEEKECMPSLKFSHYKYHRDLSSKFYENKNWVYFDESLHTKDGCYLPGLLIKFSNGETKLIGDLNPLAGLCDCCDYKTWLDENDNIIHNEPLEVLDLYEILENEN